MADASGVMTRKRCRELITLGFLWWTPRWWDDSIFSWRFLRWSCWQWRLWTDWLWWSITKFITVTKMTSSERLDFKMVDLTSLIWPLLRILLGDHLNLKIPIGVLVGRLWGSLDGLGYHHYGLWWQVFWMRPVELLTVWIMLPINQVKRHLEARACSVIFLQMFRSSMKERSSSALVKPMCV